MANSFISFPIHKMTNAEYEQYIKDDTDESPEIHIKYIHHQG
jgi:hypothetical protein